MLQSSGQKITTLDLNAVIPTDRREAKLANTEEAAAFRLLKIMRSELHGL